ncbi:MAG TPA: site-specific DNA-methyltransferase, partial [Bacteroidetes bacterium]|nr:site-specific DNA-methyltransferase [Bacteroidota bacterium]
MIPTNRLYFGDNLKFLRDRDYFPSESIDLIYLDPPFNSNQSYNVLFKDAEGTPSTAQIKAFEDTWRWDENAAKALYEINSVIDYTPQPLVALLNMLESFLCHSPMYAYLVQMAVRLVELHRILKPTGSLYLHCDPTAGHYLKLVLDAIFGPKLFRNDIIWHYRRWTAKSKRFQRMHDNILFYAKDKPLFHTLYEPYGEWINKDYPYVDDKGMRWRWHSPHGVRQKVYLKDPERGVQMNDVWTIPFIGSTSKERMGYPTQKPLVLLKRIVQASSNPGYVILDPFCGCGTTIDAVETINKENPDFPPRKWIGIDITHLAIDLIKFRLNSRFGMDRKSYEVVGEPTTLDEARALAEEDRYQFQYWALGLISARPWGEKKKGADRGIDGYRSFIHGPRRTYAKCVIQVKSGTVNPAQIRDLKGTMERENAEMAAFITLERPTQAMISEAASSDFYHSDVMNKDYPRLQILSIEQLLKDPDCFKIPPGGDLLAAPRFINKSD